MLEPDSRQLIVDALRPPAGFQLVAAAGTTFSLDLVALMIAPVAFAVFDRQDQDGYLREDPIALLQAMRTQAEKITLFCQAGQIGVPREYQSLYVYLEQSIYPVVPPEASAIFHPKVWYLKFADSNSGDVRYRLLCLSRNLTFDRSWDTVLQLDGHPSNELQHPELEDFGHALVNMANRTLPLPPERADTVRQLAAECARAQWAMPAGFDSLRFWPLGHDGHERWPFDGKRQRMLVISPFVTSGMLKRLTKGHPGSILVSRSETFDQMGAHASIHLSERLVLAAGLGINEADAGDAPAVEAVAESLSGALEGLHAKCYVADAGWRARLWTGSANCTDAAFHGNVEFLVELEGRKDRCGVETILGAEGNRLGLRKILEPYVPLSDDPQPLTEVEALELMLDRARRAIASRRFVATCIPRNDDRWTLRLEGGALDAAFDPEFAGMKIAIWPVTVGEAMAQAVPFDAASWALQFDLSQRALTPHFAVQLELDDLIVEFLIIAELVGAPADRADAVLTDILRNRADVLRFLLLLLGDVDEALAVFGDGLLGGTGDWLMGSGSDALLEPLVKAFSRDPQRVAEVAAFIESLRRSDTHAALLPDGWDEIWLPIAEALALERSR